MSQTAATLLLGSGLGLMAWLGMLPTGHPGWVAAVFAALAFALAGGGLLAGRRVLGPPGEAGTPLEAVWRRRTLVLSLAALGLLCIYASVWLLLDVRVAAVGWLLGVVSLAGLGALASLCTGLGGDRDPRGLLAAGAILSGSLASGALLAGSTVASLWSLAGFLLVQSAFWLLGGAGGDAAGEPKGRRSEAGSSALQVAGLILAAGAPLALLWMFPFKHGLAVGIVGSHLIGMVMLRWQYFVSSEREVGLGADRG